MTVIYCPALRGLYDFDAPTVPEYRELALALHDEMRWSGVGDSVLRHSLDVERIVNELWWSEGTRLAALLHDAFECVTGDVPAPVKRRYDIDMAADEDRFLGALLESFGLNGEVVGHVLEMSRSAIVKHADRKAGLTEAKELGLICSQGDFRGQRVREPERGDVNDFYRVLHELLTELGGSVWANEPEGEAGPLWI